MIGSDEIELIEVEKVEVEMVNELEFLDDVFMVDNVVMRIAESIKTDLSIYELENLLDVGSPKCKMQNIPEWIRYNRYFASI